MCERANNRFSKLRLVAHIDRSQELSLFFERITHSSVSYTIPPHSCTIEFLHFDSKNTIRLYDAMAAGSTMSLLLLMKSRFKSKDNFRSFINRLKNFCDESGIKYEISQAL